VQICEDPVLEMEICVHCGGKRSFAEEHSQRNFLEEVSMMAASGSSASSATAGAAAEPSQADLFLVPIKKADDRFVAVPLNEDTLTNDASFHKIFTVLASEIAPIEIWHKLAAELFKRGHNRRFEEVAGFLFAPGMEGVLKEHWGKSQPALIKLLSSLITFHSC
jgi:hypothetical protein